MTWIVVLLILLTILPPVAWRLGYDYGRSGGEADF